MGCLTKTNLSLKINRTKKKKHSRSADIVPQSLNLLNGSSTSCSSKCLWHLQICHLPAELHKRRHAVVALALVCSFDHVVPLCQSGPGGAVINIHENLVAEGGRPHYGTVLWESCYETTHFEWISLGQMFFNNLPSPDKLNKCYVWTDLNGHSRAGSWLMDLILWTNTCSFILKKSVDVTE